ncbi:MAG: DUF350 domain-containing protein [Desulfobacterales bacterium]|nr:DUF350 domain-containing protein [Desulfobacterales bacterium]MCF8079574.1 DUF350 domain-containing protein [Desulfobacterales bacterium]
MELTIVLLNLVYAVIGAALALLFMVLGFKVFDRITPFDTSRQLEEKNTAVGIVVGAIFVGLGIAVGLVIGLGLN